jgi:hypothetical protein
MKKNIPTGSGWITPEPVVIRGHGRGHGHWCCDGGVLPHGGGGWHWHGSVLITVVVGASRG